MFIVRSITCRYQADKLYPWFYADEYLHSSWNTLPNKRLEQSSPKVIQPVSFEQCRLYCLKYTWLPCASINYKSGSSQCELLKVTDADLDVTTSDDAEWIHESWCKLSTV